jgi:hypothetical protein
MNNVSHTEALQLLLKGYTITQTANQLGVSRTTIYNRRKDFLDYAQKEGISLALKEYNINETFEELQALASSLKNNNLDVDEAKKGVELVNIMNEIKIEDPKDFLLEVVEESKKRNISGQEIIAYTSELKKMHIETGKKYSILIDELDSKKDEKEKLDNVYENLQEQLNSVKENLENMLKEADTTKKQLVEFSEIKTRLTELGIDLEEVELVDTLFTNLKEQDYVPNDMIDFFSSAYYNKEILEREINEKNRLQERNEILNKENEKIEKLYEENLKMVASINTLKDSEILPEYIMDIVDTVKNMSDNLDLTNEESVEKFILDIKTQYNDLNDYRFKLSELESKYSAYEEKFSLLKEKIDVLEEVLDDRNNSVEALRRMEILGITDLELIEWKNIIEEQYNDITLFRNEIVKLDGFSKYIEDKTENINVLEKKEKMLQDNIKDLDAEIIATSETLNSIRRTISVQTEQIQQMLDDFEDYFTSSETGFKTRSRRIFDDITENMLNLLSKTNIQWNEEMETLDNTVNKILEESNRILANAYAGGRLVGRFHALEPIHKILQEEPIPKTEATIAVITMLAYIKAWSIKYYSNEISERCDYIIELLTSDLGDIHQ